MDHVKELLSPYLDKELSNEDGGIVETHLSHCQECTAALRELRATIQQVREIPAAPLPQGFMKRLEKKFEAGFSKPSFSPWTFPGPWKVAALALTAVGVTFLVFKEKPRYQNLETFSSPQSEERQEPVPEDISSSALNRQEGIAPRASEKSVRAKSLPVKKSSATKHPSSASERKKAVASGQKRRAPRLADQIKFAERGDAPPEPEVPVRNLRNPKPYEVKNFNASSPEEAGAILEADTIVSIAGVPQKGALSYRTPSRASEDASAIQVQEELAPSQRALDLVKNYRTSSRETLLQKIQAKGGREEWSIQVLRENVYQVKCQIFFSTSPSADRNPVITYLFRVDLNQKTVKDLNASARELLE
ncbi:MAG: zf-HC2 domain-containing protein [Elusimicrobia bacterium]|nr:zf-HC2 domain-containing protein [Elusimicrobiota bacterium]